MLKIENIANVLWLIFGFGGAYIYITEEKYWRFILFFAIGIAYLVKLIKKQSKLKD